MMKALNWSIPKVYLPTLKDLFGLKSKNSIENYSKFEYIQKRAVDYSVSFLLFTALIIPIAFIIFRIKRESPGPILFKQNRVGLNGEIFTCYKFRSMHVDSKFNPYTQEEDNRIFPTGKIMRKMRLDEVPQLINVIKGDMHIVGPRAEWDILVKEYEKVIPNYHLRHKVRPGITGLAQVRYQYGRGVFDSKKKLKYDLYYIKNWNIFLEIRVLFETVFTVIGKKGV
jgi:lipopolysaccharide/colanic/teichoic acid biosynthesis glycosyltransferase